MPYGLLIAKLSGYGLSNDTCEFMSSYLCDRYQSVKISNNKSSWKKMLKGISQGSGLRPLLFNAFLNDVFYLMEICDNYADDNTPKVIQYTLNLLISAQKIDVENAMSWFTENCMHTNPTRFQFMLMKKNTQVKK